MTNLLSDKIQVLRDEVLNTEERGPDATGGEIFDAIVHRLASYNETNPDIDLSLNDVLARRLAWGEPEASIIADADSVCKRLAAAAVRSLRHYDDERRVIEAATEVADATARFVAMAVVQRAGKERTAIRRQEALLAKLDDAIAAQKAEIEILEKKVARQPTERA